MTDQELMDMETRASRANGDLFTTQGDVKALAGELRRMRKAESDKQNPEAERKHIEERARSMGWRPPERQREERPNTGGGSGGSEPTGAPPQK